ncbi:MAG: multidrug DMT transporter permease [Candidatus Glassbacteria bacterium RIFCSPLOWO2_12_FULL_58_11]|uniref:Multidrug DMT transporter permease n=1 Tax=Candidatus Glassbacteria bacterium RIFCSPLOWO2_12_FULL_58_11 TaxID=1817867 RepID=A0A1F5YRP4_9BACT|nr:MAG: multidrug DMT transporter permease [Candidatus Glassbacteria bacterium RIFCSPLOWO2_12_FULL_58_11]
MFILNSYATAVIFCIVTMLCWGSWANTQKLAGRHWRFELFYWDYALGVLLLSVIFGLTLGSTGTAGRSFLADLAQAERANIFSAVLGGIIFNLSNILLVAAIATAGMAVAFPVGVGLALVIGVVTSYLVKPEGNPTILLLGVGVVVLAIILDAVAYRRLGSGSSSGTRGIVLSVAAGVLMGFFYRWVAQSRAADFINPQAGMLTPYGAVFFFSLGLFLSNFLWNTLAMKFPFAGEPVPLKDYFKGSAGVHLTGILGGIIWNVGMSFSIIASGQAGFAISYGLGQGATMVAAFWGVFIWREFSGAPKGTAKLLAAMFAGYIIGLSLIIYARTAAGG